MKLHSIYLRNFRNYESVTVSFADGINFIYGKNGQGKTNLLEAIYLLSTGRSFRTSKLQDLIRHGESFFFIEAEFEKDGIDQRLSISYDGQVKQVKHNETKSQNFSALLGIFPSTLHAPGDIELIHGSPSERRRLLNMHIAQSDPVYVYHLARYTKALKQRNALLKRKDTKSMEAWEAELIRSGAYLTERRGEATVEMTPKRLIEEISLNYEPSYATEENFEKSRERDLILGSTQSGPHRDDITILLSEKPAKSFASEGQKRTLLTALKLAEHERLCNRCNTTAIFNIDDFGVHLDPARTDDIKNHLKKLGQVFLTSPVACSIHGAHVLSVESGVIELV
ncbi:MAG: DNA replication/repair protein RecF [Simkaniaceae bacterium]|nr:DNA replication/repair protein RecF [Simkaniaceae bacterium]